MITLTSPKYPIYKNHQAWIAVNIASIVDTIFDFRYYATQGHGYTLPI